jgi:hypothetical protein
VDLLSLLLVSVGTAVLIGLAIAAFIVSANKRVRVLCPGCKRPAVPMHRDIPDWFACDRCLRWWRERPCP